MSDSKNRYGFGSCFSIQVDLDDWNKLKNYGWYVNRKKYIYTMIDNKTILLHRFIFNFIPHGMTVDHIDGNKLKNVKTNLQFLTNEENNKKSWKDETRQHLRKTTLMIDKNNNNVLMEFKDSVSAKNWLKENGHPNASQGNISNICLNKKGMKTIYGYKWRYK